MAAFVLTEEDRAWLRTLVEDYSSRTGRARPGGPRSEDADLPAPETYVALTPSPSGLPALSRSGTTGTGSEDAADDVPGYAECPLYRISKTSSGARFERVMATPPTVYNLLDAAIPGGRWIVVTRDKFGCWLFTGAFGLELTTC